jgi:fatty acid desaturase
MEYEEFVEAYKAKKVSIMVNRSAAVHAMDGPMLPKRYRIAHHFWAWMAILLIPTAIVVGIFVQWWVGVIVFITALIMFPAVQKAAADNVAEYAIEDKSFFELASKIGLIMVKPVG